MNINGNSIFMGAYAERRQQETLLHPKALNVSDDRQTEITGKLKEAMQGIDRGLETKKTFTGGKSFPGYELQIYFICKGKQSE